MAKRRHFRCKANLLPILAAGVANSLLAPGVARAEGAMSPPSGHGAVATREAELAPVAGAGAHDAREREPIRSYLDEQGRACRDYERSVVIDGARRTALATVCRDATGRWVLSR